MSGYIEDVLECLEAMKKANKNSDDRYIYAKVIQLIKDTLSADVVEVVRCKKCRFYEAKQKGKPWSVSRKYCSRSAMIATQPDDYCSYGKRKEQEHE